MLILSIFSFKLIESSILSLLRDCSSFNCCFRISSRFDKSKYLSLSFLLVMSSFSCVIWWNNVSICLLILSTFSFELIELLISVKHFFIFCGVCFVVLSLVSFILLYLLLIVFFRLFSISFSIFLLLYFTFSSISLDLIILLSLVTFIVISSSK